MHCAWKGRPRNDLYCVGHDVKPYSLAHSSQFCPSVCPSVCHTGRSVKNDAS